MKIKALVERQRELFAIKNRACIKILKSGHSKNKLRIKRGMNLLDQRTAFLLQKINVLCADGKYKILEKEELLSSFPAYLQQDEEGLDGMLSYLKEHQYVDVKYADKARGVYCLYPLPAGRIYAEKTYRQKAEAFDSLKKIVFGTFVAAFIGAALGSGMVMLLIAIIG